MEGNKVLLSETYSAERPNRLSSADPAEPIAVKRSADRRPEMANRERCDKVCVGSDGSAAAARPQLREKLGFNCVPELPLPGRYCGTRG